MKIMTMTCGTCCGFGTIDNWIVEQEPIDRECGIAKREKVKCTACDGKGYTEYAVFEIEEAKQILKACGLSTES